MLEPYAGKSAYDNQGQRVVVGQRLMQSSSDIFLGWARSQRGNDFYVRQLRDMKFSVPVEGVTGSAAPALRGVLRHDVGPCSCQIRRRDHHQRIPRQRGAV